MFSLRVIVSLLLVVSATASGVIFEDSPSTSQDNANVGTRNGPFDDSVVIEAAGSPSNGDVDSRFFGLLGGKYFAFYFKVIFCVTVLFQLLNGNLKR